MGGIVLEKNFTRNVNDLEKEQKGQKRNIK
jgi:hypothetical protein